MCVQLILGGANRDREYASSGALARLKPDIPTFCESSTSPTTRLRKGTFLAMARAFDWWSMIEIDPFPGAHESTTTSSPSARTLAPRFARPGESAQGAAIAELGDLDAVGSHEEQPSRALLNRRDPKAPLLLPDDLPVLRSVDGELVAGRLNHVVSGQREVRPGCARLRPDHVDTIAQRRGRTRWPSRMYRTHCRSERVRASLSTIAVARLRPVAGSSS